MARRGRPPSTAVLLILALEHGQDLLRGGARRIEERKQLVRCSWAGQEQQDSAEGLHFVERT